MTPPGKRVQTINGPGSETGPGTVATWGELLPMKLMRWVLNGNGTADRGNTFLLIGMGHELYYNFIAIDISIHFSATKSLKK
jgi:hypothetical protein